MRVHSAHNKADGNFLQLCLVLTSLPNLLSTTATKLPQFLPDQRTTILCYGKYTCEKRKRNRLWYYGDNRHTAAYFSVKLASLCICSAVRYSHVKYFWWWPKCANHFPGLPKVDLVQRISQLALHFFYHFPHINQMPLCHSKSHAHLPPN